ncbi:hypothetical protein, variant 1 [Cryptococcus amylolentus CBS 6039]|uniref:Glucose-6-phosphate 1-epimerase n=2 Tax=Cryptococcus amylolentus CBS 6039 TaxID=1295533 RepID=A0A1E3HIG8_9TREE|nr:hypothetical protein, variant 1 [Cryptococcus amylolentus CBS 6039]ODN76133.1 hypothetical protein, variant 1 [Cryptococcus amylolentus CBS 6039]
MGVSQNEQTVTLTHESGASAEIYLFGATLTSWKQGGKERMFVSSKSKLDGTRAIRGGIPVVFPIFGPPPSSPPEYAALPQHGFARTSQWALEETIMDRPEGVSVRFVHPGPPATFPHEFKLSYVVTLTAHQLSTDVHVVNSGKEDFKFQTLLHNYLAVPDSSKIKITGIDKGTTYKDKVLGMKEYESDGSALVIDKEIDRVYQKVPSQEIVVDDGAGSGYKVHFHGLEDCTIWNPQEATGSQMTDMEAGGWDRYICIEPGYVREFKTLAPGEEFTGAQTITAL